MAKRKGKATHTVVPTKNHTKATSKANNPSRNELFYNWFIKKGYAKAGQHITMTQVRKALKIIVPVCMDEDDCRNLALKLLGPIGYTRDRLLAKGLYFGQKNGNFRVMALKDTSKAIVGYATKARNAMNRGQTLNDNLAKQYNKHKIANHRAFITAIASVSKVQP